MNTENTLQIFENQEFGNIRIVDCDGEPWFVGKDVAVALGYSNPNKAIQDHVDDDDKLNNETLTSLGQRGGWLINESGLYSLVMGSKLPTAKKFKRWVTSEVLPAIRKTGSYIKQTPETDEMLLSRALLIADKNIKLLQAENQQKTEQIAKLEPKASYYDLCLQTQDAIAISTIAKDYGFSAQRMNSELHNRGIQYKRGDVWLLYQKYANEGYTVTKSNLYEDEHGNEHSKIHTYWTQKGRLFIYDLLKRDGVTPLVETIM